MSPTANVMMTSCLLVPLDSLYLSIFCSNSGSKKTNIGKIWREDLSVNSVEHTDLVQEGGVLFASRWWARDAIQKDVSSDKSTLHGESAKNVTAMVVSSF